MDLSTYDEGDEASVASDSDTVPMEVCYTTTNIKSFTTIQSELSNESNKTSRNIREAIENATQTDLTLDDISYYETINQDQCKLIRKINAERMKSCRLRKKVKSLQEIIIQLRDESVVSRGFLAHVEEICGPGALKFIENELRNRHRHSVSYSDEIKKFAFTVYFHSPAAYRYLRSYFTLPHERTLIRWLGNMDGLPGFTDATFNILKRRLENNEIEHDCVLIIDSMNLRKQRIYSPHEGKNVGFVDIGIGDENPNLAGEALVFLVKGMKTKWRYPIGYFLVGKFACCLFHGVTVYDI